MSKKPSKTGVEIIAEERERQISKERWSSGHDDTHTMGQLPDAAAAYATVAAQQVAGESRTISASPENWPWNESDWKPDINPIRNLAKAGALIAAEIDRLNRKIRKENERTD